MACGRASVAGDPRAARDRAPRAAPPMDAPEAACSSSVTRSRRFCSATSAARSSSSIGMPSCAWQRCLPNSGNTLVQHPAVASAAIRAARAVPIARSNQRSAASCSPRCSSSSATNSAGFPPDDSLCSSARRCPGVRFRAVIEAQLGEAVAGVGGVVVTESEQPTQQCGRPVHVARVLPLLRRPSRISLRSPGFNTMRSSCRAIAESSP